MELGHYTNIVIGSAAVAPQDLTPAEEIALRKANPDPAINSKCNQESGDSASQPSYSPNGSAISAEPSAEPESIKLVNYNSSGQPLQNFPLDQSESAVEKNPDDASYFQKSKISEPSDAKPAPVQVIALSVANDNAEKASESLQDIHAQSFAGVISPHLSTESVHATTATRNYTPSAAGDVVLTVYGTGSENDGVYSEVITQSDGRDYSQMDENITLESNVARSSEGDHLGVLASLMAGAELVDNAYEGMDNRSPRANREYDDVANRGSGIDMYYSQDGYGNVPSPPTRWTRSGRVVAQGKKREVEVWDEYEEEEEDGAADYDNIYDDHQQRSSIDSEDEDYWEEDSQSTRRKRKAKATTTEAKKAPRTRAKAPRGAGSSQSSQEVNANRDVEPSAPGKRRRKLTERALSVWAREEDESPPNLITHKNVVGRASAFPYSNAEQSSARVYASGTNKPAWQPGLSRFLGVSRGQGPKGVRMVWYATISLSRVYKSTQGPKRLGSHYISRERAEQYYISRSRMYGLDETKKLRSDWPGEEVAFRMELEAGIDPVTGIPFSEFEDTIRFGLIEKYKRHKYVAGYGKLVDNIGGSSPYTFVRHAPGQEPDDVQTASQLSEANGEGDLKHEDTLADPQTQEFIADEDSTQSKSSQPEGDAIFSSPAASEDINI